MSPATKNSVSFTFGGNIKLAPQETIIGFEVNVSGGGFESISSLPKGWRIAIDNKSVSQTALNADLAFGSEALTPDDLKAIVLTLSQIELEGLVFRVIGHLLVSNLGSERRVTLSSQNFVPR